MGNRNRSTPISNLGIGGCRQKTLKAELKTGGCLLFVLVNLISSIQIEALKGNLKNGVNQLKIIWL